MTKVLCLNPPSEPGFMRNGRWTTYSRANQQWMPIWLSYTTGYLIKHGYNAGLLDASAQNMTYEMTLLYIKEVLKPDVVFYYWCFDNIEPDLLFADLLAKYTRVILVGPWSMCAPDALLKTKRINIMTYGEFEHTSLELLQNPHYTDVKGVIWRNHLDNTIHKNPPRPLCSSQELDEMPFVSKTYKDFLNLRLYRQTSFKYPFTDLIGSRGCINQCSFCTWIRAFQGGPSYRSRSTKNIIEELWYIKNNLSEVKQIFFQDDTLPQKHAIELSQAIIDENLKICWGGYSRAEQSLETLQLMRESGCETLHIGYESINDKTLSLINKGLTFEQIQTFTQNINKSGISYCAGFMIFPWQTKEAIHQLIHWVKANVQPRNHTRFSFTHVIAYPNTPICQTILHQKS
jgi:anaerobic magnesium-protoporphyrin IX monomethyl ester cyclase